MNKSLLLLFLLLFFCGSDAASQRIQYSRQTVVPDHMPNRTELVANVAGNHHLICFANGRKPEIFVFDAELRLQVKKELPYTLKPNCEIQLLPFNGFYYLYLHIANTAQHELWKINPEGDAFSMSQHFQGFVDSVLQGSAVPCQLLNRNGQLVALSHTYFDEIKKIRSTVTRFNDQLLPAHVQRVVFPHDGRTTILNQASLIRNELLLLRTSRNEGGRTLEIGKLHLDSLTFISNTFHAASHIYVNPAIEYEERDSSLLLYATLQSTSGGPRIVFISRLNAQLQEAVPLALLKRQFRDNTVSSYLWLDGKTPRWLSFHNMMQPREALANSTPPVSDQWLYPDGSTLNNPVNTIRWMNGPARQQTAVRFTLLNEQFAIKKDSLVANEKNHNDIQPYTLAQVTLQGRNCLVVLQNFSSKQKGLLLMYVNEKGELQHQDIAVFGRYDFRLSQTRAVDGQSFILPYVNKKEFGLVKISYDEDELAPFNVKNKP